MPRVTFIGPDGSRRTVAAAAGVTLMEAARQNDVPGVVAQCGGACACATCHVYIAAPWQEKLEPPEDMELGMLESAWEPRATSRLSCQVQLSADLEGLEVVIPERQGGGETG